MKQPPPAADGNLPAQVGAEKQISPLRGHSLITDCLLKNFLFFMINYLPSHPSFMFLCVDFAGTEQYK